MHAGFQLVQAYAPEDGVALYLRFVRPNGAPDLAVVDDESLWAAVKEAEVPLPLSSSYVAVAPSKTVLRLAVTLAPVASSNLASAVQSVADAAARAAQSMGPRFEELLNEMADVASNLIANVANASSAMADDVRTQTRQGSRNQIVSRP